MSRGISARSNLAETCHAMLVSTDGMSKPRHQQLLQSLPVNFCGPMVYSNKLVDHGSNHICDFGWFSTSTCDMESVSRGNLSSTRLPRPMSTQGLSEAVGYLAHGITLWSMSGCQYLLEFCWSSVGIPVGDSHWFSHFPSFPRISTGFPKISGRSPEVGHAVFPDGTQIKQRALLVEFNRDCTLKVMWVYNFLWVITCFNVFINPL